MSFAPKVLALFGGVFLTSCVLFVWADDLGDDARRLLAAVESIGRGNICISAPKKQYGKQVILRVGDGPKITLRGEDHKNKDDQALKSEWRAEAGRGDYVLGLEAYDFGDTTFLNETLHLDPKTSRVNGIEEPFRRQICARVASHCDLENAVTQNEAAKQNFEAVSSTATITSKRFTDAQKRLNKARDELQDQKRSFLIDFIHNQNLQEIWVQNRSHYGKSDLSQAVDEMIKNNINKPIWMMNLAEAMESPDWNKNEDFIRISKKFAQDSLEWAEDDKNKAKYETPTLTSAYEWLNHPENEAAESKFLADVSIPWRNKAMARSIYALYNQTKNEENDLRFICGSDHLAGLVPMLESFGLKESPE